MTSVETAYVQLKQQLELLSYTEPCGLDSAPLVSRLLSDLILTTENYNLVKDKYESVDRQLNLYKSDVSSLRSENQRLVRENNELHIESLKAKEDVQRIKYEMEASVSNLKDGESDSRFLANTQRKVILQKEAEIAALNERLNLLIAHARSGGLDVEQFRHVEVKDSTSSSLGDLNKYGVFSDEKNGLSDGNKHSGNDYSDVIARLQNELSSARLLITRHSTEVASLSAAVEMRDKEIQRLTAALRSGNPSSTSSSGPTVHEDANARLIKQLREQNDFLLAELSSREMEGNSSSSNTIGVDNSTRVSALELEATRLASRLDAALKEKSRLELSESSLKKELSEIQNLLVVAQTTIDAASNETESKYNSKGSSVPNTAQSAALAADRAAKGPLRVPSSTLVDTLRELARCHEEFARVTAAAEAVALARDALQRKLERSDALLQEAEMRAKSEALSRQQMESQLVHERSAAAAAESSRQAAQNALEALRHSLNSSESEKLELLKRLQSADSELASLRPLCGRLSQELEVLRSQQASLQRSLDSAVSDARNAQNSRDSAISAESSTAAELRRTRDREAALQAELESLRRLVDTLTRERDSLASKLQIESDLVAEWRSRAELEAGRFAEAARQADSLGAALASESRSSAQISDENAKLKGLKFLEEDVVVLRAEVRELQARGAAMAVSLDGAARARARAEEDLQAEREQHRAAERALDEAGRKAAVIQTRVLSLESELQTAQAAAAQLQLELQHEGQLYRQAQQKLDAAENYLSSEKNKSVELQLRLEAREAELRTAAAAQDELRQQLAAAHAATESFAAAAAAAESAQAAATAELLAAQTALRQELLARGELEGAAERGDSARRLAERALEGTEGQISELRALLESEKSKNVELNALFSQFDRTREQLGQQLAAAQARVRQLEQEVVDLRLEISTQGTVIVGERSRAELHLGRESEALAALDESRRQLQAAEASAARLREQVSTLEAEKKSLQTDAAALRTELSQLSDAAAVQERLVLRMRAESAAAADSLRDALDQRDSARTEVRRAAEDVEAMTKSVNTLGAEITQLRNASADANAQTAAVRAQLRQAEDALAQLHSERAELLSLYSGVCSERAALLTEIDQAQQHGRQSEHALTEALVAQQRLDARLAAEARLREQQEQQSAVLESQLAALSAELLETRALLQGSADGEEARAAQAAQIQQSAQAYATALKTVREDLARARNDCRAANEGVAAALAEKAAATAALQQTQARLDTIEGLLLESRSAQAHAHAEVARLSAENEELVATVHRLKNNKGTAAGTAGTDSSLSEGVQQSLKVQELNSTVNALQAQLTGAEIEKNALQREIASLSQQLVSIDIQKRNARDMHRANDVDTAEFTAATAESVAKALVLQDEVIALKKKNDELKARLRSTELELKKVNDRYNLMSLEAQSQQRKLMQISDAAVSSALDISGSNFNTQGSNSGRSNRL